MADHDADLFVIGGGSGGVRAARIAAEHGARVIVAEEYRLGGTCVIRGCIPKKLFVYASRFHGEFEDAAGFGWTVPHASFDWKTLVANKDREIARLEAAYGATLAKASVKVVKSRAVLVDAHTVQLTNRDRGRGAYILPATCAARWRRAASRSSPDAKSPRSNWTAATIRCGSPAAIKSPPTASCSPSAAGRMSTGWGSPKPASRSARTAAWRLTNIRAPRRRTSMPSAM